MDKFMKEVIEMVKENYKVIAIGVIVLVAIFFGDSSGV